jgi:hypothetical protein
MDDIIRKNDMIVVGWSGKSVGSMVGWLVVGDDMFWSRMKRKWWMDGWWTIKNVQRYSTFNAVKLLLLAE